ncbi:GNAT family N-acetyltransferase [Clostridium gasigenes]|uniref:Acetyltransferase (GNAT) family protein n=1 Tax=Clostridium gasigenes TaxID=94869 RepID=A0A1H0RI18_9CLOT|nr:GNAT family N-acetyltransferase [Clostridium gasigenes]MBB6715223.1 GNAT family N-acetyltransferase [Clostridium gasigenes]SDP29091.1 Acetyltransferase (GNAT) family protein [Clostridium gasigenes]
MEWKEGEYKISNDKSLLSVEEICGLLSKSYWASKRPREVIEKSIENSICYGVYHIEKQIGYGRIITDYATTYYICDVILDEEHRGKGLGKKLIECMIEFDEVCSGFGMLATKDAHGLYGQYGFKKDEKTFMRRIPII